MPMGFAVGVDGHLGFGDLIESSLSLRGELIVAPHHTLVVRAGIGSVQWMDTEYDDPIYRERYARVGYRLSSTHIYGGIELGRAWYQAHWDWVDNMPPHDGSWFAGTLYDRFGYYETVCGGAGACATSAYANVAPMPSPTTSGYV